MNNITINQASFRDPDGFVFESNGIVYRAIHKNYTETFNEIIATGLFERLIKEELLLPFTIERDITFNIPDHTIIIKPYQLKHTTYPYEWPLNQFIDAALCTLKIQEICIAYGFHLKDATPFNIQFIEGKLKLIDTLSFCRPNNHLWEGYKQYCESFFAPLLLMTKIEKDLVRIFQIYPNGLPLQLVSKILPHRSWLNMSILFHIHLHAHSQKLHHRGEKKMSQDSSLKFNQHQDIGLVSSLQSGIRAINKGNSVFNWADYYQSDAVNPKYLENKISIISNILSNTKPNLVLDIGTNTGVFAKIASNYAETVVALDRDPVSINHLYSLIKKEQIRNIIPMVMDILNPSPSLGWMNKERSSFFERVNPDLVMLLGISHHLLAQANINFTKLLELCLITKKYLILEYIPPEDPNYRNLFVSRQNQFEWYTKESLILNLQNKFNVIDIKQVDPTNRSIIFLEKKK